MAVVLLLRHLHLAQEAPVARVALGGLPTESVSYQEGDVPVPLFTRPLEPCEGLIELSALCMKACDGVWGVLPMA